MAIPYIKVQADESIQILDDCIVKGYQVKDKINGEYFQNKTSIDAEKIACWNQEAIDWANECLSKLSEVFVSQKELYEFRDAPVSSLMRVNTNIEWNHIINVLEARIKRLNEYDSYIRSEFNVQIEVVGRDKIIQGADSKVEIKN